MMKPNLPSSNGFWRLASGFLDAGEATYKLIETPPPSGTQAFEVCMFLYFRCIELALKSVLVRNLVPKQEIVNKLGHRISRLLDSTGKCIPLSDIGISLTDRKFLDLYSDDYSDKWFEYPDQPWKHPELDIAALRDLGNIACRVTEEVRKLG